MAQLERRDGLAVVAGFLNRLVQRAGGRAPANDEYFARVGPVNLRHRQFIGQRLELIAALVRHALVQVRRRAGMPPLVVLQTGHHRVSAVLDPRPRRTMPARTGLRLKVVRLVGRGWRQVGRQIPANLLQLRLIERLDPGRDGLITQQHDRHAVSAGDIHRLHRRVKTILHIGRGQHHARGVAVSAEAGNVQVGLLDVRG